MPDSATPAPPAPGRREQGRKLLWLILGLYLLDQITKWLIVLYYHTPRPVFGEEGRYLGSIVDQTPVIDNFLQIVRVHNTGVAFGFGNGTTWSTYVFLAVPLIAVCVLIILFRRGVFSTPALRLCGALLLAGVLGNLTDRLCQGFMLQGAENLTFLQNLANGYVVDFIDVTVPFTNGYHWPSFNVADSCISIAAVLLFLLGFKNNKTDSAQPS